MKWPINFALGLAGAVAVFTAGAECCATHHTWTGHALALAGGLALGIVARRADRK